MVTKLERDFVRDLKKELDKRFPGCYILKQDPNMRQGIPDQLVLFQDKWASLETKRGFKDKKEPNQDHYVQTFNEMSFAAFVNPNNMNEVLDEMEQAFGVAG